MYTVELIEQNEKEEHALNQKKFFEEEFMKYIRGVFRKTVDILSSFVSVWQEVIMWGIGDTIKIEFNHCRR